MNPPLIEFSEVTKRFDGRTVLDRVNLQIYEGEVTTIIGLSGSGKSVLLKHIIGLMKPDEGLILIKGKPLGEMKKSERLAHLSRISYMFQGNALFDSMTVYDNIALPLRETTNLSKEKIDELVMARIRQAELEEAKDRYPSQLSGGMQKRVALARALVTNPQIVLFDEPTTGQDPVRKNSILSMIAQYQKKYAFTAILVSHEIPDVYFISNRILALYDKKIVFQGSPEELENFSHPFKDEVIHSLESLQKELTGLYSIRQFRNLHQAQLEPRRDGRAYTLIVFTLSVVSDLVSAVALEANQALIRAFSILLDKHFGMLGGFSTRRQANEFLTALPLINLEEAEKALGEFVEILKKTVMDNILAQAQTRLALQCFEFKILAGMAQGQTSADIDAVLAAAKAAQKLILQQRCDLGGKVQ